MKNLLFDIDGTLLLTNGSGAHALNYALCETFGVETPCVDVDFCGRTDCSLLPEVLQRNGISTTQENLRRLMTSYTHRLPDTLNKYGGTVLPGVADLLQKLVKRTDVRCYVMTGNLHQTATQKLQHFGLLKFFRGIFAGDQDADRRHLAQRTARSLTQTHGSEPESDTIVIGDTPADIDCGLEIGASVLAVCTGQFDRRSLELAGAHLVQDDLSSSATLYRWLLS